MSWLNDIWTGYKLTQWPYFFKTRETTDNTILIENRIKGIFGGISLGMLIAGGIAAYMLLKKK